MSRVINKIAEERLVPPRKRFTSRRAGACVGREGQVASDVLELGLSTTQKTPMYGVVTISRSVMMHTVCIKQAKNKNVYNGMELKRLRKILSTLQNFTRNVFFCRLSTARCWRLASRTSAMGKATPLLFHIMVEYVPRLLSPESKKVAKSSRTVSLFFFSDPRQAKQKRPHCLRSRV